jgi:hypothetical protein
MRGSLSKPRNYADPSKTESRQRQSAKHGPGLSTRWMSAQKENPLQSFEIACLAEGKGN